MQKEELKTAFLNRDFDRAQALLNEWAQDVSVGIKAAQGDAQRRRIFDEACSFAEGNICLARVVRAHIATELQANSGSFLYQDSDLEPTRWQIKA